MKIKYGFTLIELSIVLVIIGLIIGGVLVGRDLIASAAIRSQIKQIEEFRTAANTFRIKYGYLPGDIPPTETAQLGIFTFTGTYAGKTYVGFPSYNYGNNSGTVDLNSENYVFWQHLSETKMIAGAYGGSTSQGNYLVSDASFLTASTAGKPTNAISQPSGYDIFAPQSKFSHSDNHITCRENSSFGTPLYSGSPLRNLFQFYATPYQEYSIDSKLDDGAPSTGTIRDNGFSYLNSPAATCITSAPYAYNTSSATANIVSTCQMAILW